MAYRHVLKTLVRTLAFVGTGAALACSAVPVTPGTGGGGQGGTAGHGTGAGGDGVGGLPLVGGSGGLGGGLGGGPPTSLCHVVDDDAQVAPTCEEAAMAQTFSPKVKWVWAAPGTAGGFISGSASVPLVGNFTDDNNDGSIDLCDIPDILVVAFEGAESNAGALYLLAGDTGVEEVKFSAPVNGYGTPAFGDIDGDGIVEVVAVGLDGRLVAFENDGSVKWMSAIAYDYNLGWSSYPVVSIYDIDADGAPEILAGALVYDNLGNELFGDPPTSDEVAFSPTAADLDGDGLLEVIHGPRAYRADGTIYYDVGDQAFWTNDGLYIRGAFAQVANLDADPEPEIYLTAHTGITILEHTGQIKLGPVKPILDGNGIQYCYLRPAVIHDFDGDSIADVAAASCTKYMVSHVNGASITPVWTADAQDQSGAAATTAFDLLGDGTADALYGGETTIYAWDGKLGNIEFTAPNSSGTIFEHPIVADVDNDGSADIVYVSNTFDGSSGTPTVTVLSDKDNLWIPARRIWNQHAYHVTNVREDGTIPKVMKKHWQLLNTFRSNSQISKAGIDCDPEVPN